MTVLNFHYPKGRVLAHGYFFGSLIPEHIAQTRILSLWEDHSSLYSFELGYVLIQKKTQSVLVDDCLGAPLIAQDHLLCNVLVDPAGNLLSARGELSVCLALGGEFHHIDIANEPTYDPSLWLDLGGYSEIETDTLGKIQKPELRKKEKAVSLRESLEDPKLKESPGLKKTLGRLDEISHDEKNGVGTGGAGLGFLMSRLKRAFTRRDSGSTGNGREIYNPYPKSAASAGIFAKIASAFSQFLMNSALAKVIGKAHAKHVQKMMDQFNDGNLEDALQNAIPLGNLRDALEAKNTSLSLSGRNLPQSIQPYSQSSGSMVALENNLLFQMQKLYEQAFKTLDQQGDYKKAAFVLAELLRDIDRAVQYLEKHKEFRLAAELAEGQKLDPPRIVRQWVLAKDLQRAMEITVIAGCYQEAITLLQIGHPTQATDLRWYCANLHYQAGDIETAVEIAWPISHKRNEVVEWMKIGFELGGETGIRHLLRLALHDPGNFESYISLIDQNFQSDSFREGLALIDEIIKSGNGHSNKRIASMAARYYLSTVSKGSLKFDRQRWNQLCRIAGDLTLRADVRGIDLKQFEGTNIEVWQLTRFKFGPSHGRHAEDCVRLNGGLMLVAFGESGLELWNSKGVLLSRFAVPCHNIVVSDQGNRALLIANRLGYQIVHQFDLKDRSVGHWLELDIHRWADTFDGHTWIVSHENRVFVLNVLAAEQSTIWSINELPGLVEGIVRTKDSFSILLFAEEEFQIWVYQLPNLFLQERTPHSMELLGKFQPAAISEKGGIVGISREEENAFGMFNRHAEIDWKSLDAKNEIKRLLYMDEFLFLLNTSKEMACVNIFPVSYGKIQASNLVVSFDDTESLVMRYDGSYLVMLNGDGRVVSINVALKYVDVDFVLV